MPLPPLLIYNEISEYKSHYERHYQRGNIVTFDGIRIYFKPQKFGHAFYQNSQKCKGPKDEFSPERAQRMDWIKATLENPQAEIYMGWDSYTKLYQENRRVTVVYGNFVVVVELSLNGLGQLKGNFITCYVADASINKIRTSPSWDKEKCMIKLEK
jgi:hypothetical protein